MINVESQHLDLFRHCHLLLAFNNIVLRVPVSGGCILSWCLVQCLLHFWTNIIDWNFDWISVIR